eukprot:TRINITY_DN2358_c0_g1_i2.p1 TRINITY_DN2358_c0_g1~~TRINITY_DN2358_c0_g1_i2.p1  ORF type:complete len:351 (+),score=19.78 TRINITY_DN2358_c0_g1_i2:34-1086(+)
MHLLRHSPCVLLFLLFACVAPSISQFVPKILECGTPQDVRTVPANSYPVSISGDRDSLISSVVTWRGPYPSVNTSLFFKGNIISYLVQDNKFLHETNGTGPLNPFESFDLLSLTWEASRTTISTCQGFYLRTNLTNGAHLELNWYIYMNDFNFDLGGIDATVQKGYPKFSYYLSNYPFAYPNQSSITFQKYTRFPGSVAYIPTWSIQLGKASFRIPTQFKNSTMMGGFVPPLGTTHEGILGNYIINPIGVLYRYFDFSLVNNVPATIYQSGAPEEMTGAGVLSISINETHVAPFTGTDDILYFDPIISFAVNATSLGGSDGSESSASDGFKSSLFSLLLSFSRALLPFLL